MPDETLFVNSLIGEFHFCSISFNQNLYFTLDSAHHLGKIPFVHFLIKGIPKVPVMQIGFVDRSFAVFPFLPNSSNLISNNQSDPILTGFFQSVDFLHK